jgi:hypothetical protein
MPVILKYIVAPESRLILVAVLCPNSAGAGLICKGALLKRTSFRGQASDCLFHVIGKRPEELENLAKTHT